MAINKYNQISSDRVITEKQAYEAMLFMLYYYYELTDSSDITDILSGGEYMDPDAPGDTAFWEYFEDAVDKVLAGEKPNKHW